MTNRLFQKDLSPFTPGHPQGGGVMYQPWRAISP